MAKFLRENKPWSRLVALENIAIREVAPGSEIVLTDSLRATPIRVPHRDEDSDTVAWLIRGPARSILWLPDIDKWEKWDRSLPALLEDPALVAFVDGTFHSADEIPGRSIAEIPHPLVPETAALLAGMPQARGRVYLVHLNHTNRLLWDENAKAALAERGIGVAREGQRISLAGSAAPATPARRRHGSKIDLPCPPRCPIRLPFCPGAARRRTIAPAGPRATGARSSGGGCASAAPCAARAACFGRTS